MSTPARTRMTAGPFLAALVTMFLLAGPYLANLLVEHSRQVYMWRVRDNLLLVAMMLSLAGGAVLVRRGLRRLQRPVLLRVYDHLFVVAVGAGLLANLCFQTWRPVGYYPSQYGMEVRTLWILLGAAIGFSLARRTDWLVLRCRQLCAILSPVMAIVLFNLLSSATYPPRMDPLPVAEKNVRVDHASVQVATNDRPVYLFIFDEWSYERTYHDGQVRSDMPNLARLSTQAVTFREARSCGECTETSIPRLLFETDLPVSYLPGRIGFERDGRFVRTDEFTSIFEHYRQAGYRTIMIGFALPFAQILGDQIDCCRTYSWFHQRPSLAVEAGAHVVRTMKYWTDPWSQFVYDRLWPELQYDQILARQQDMKRDVLDILAMRSGRTMAVVHYALPHNPYMYDDNGAYSGAADTCYHWSDVPGYERNLRALDCFIGEIVATLQQSGRFDDATLILTSDHSFRYDPDRRTGRITAPLNHVPLIVKLPEQHEAVTVEQLYAMNSVSRLIDNAVNNGSDAHTALAFKTR